jgi:hypothetical protein
LAAARNFWVFSQRKLISLPARSSRIKVTPPAVPMPGMAGGEKAKAMPWGSLPNSRFRLAMMASYFSSGFFRSCQGLRVTKKKPL